MNKSAPKNTKVVSASLQDTTLQAAMCEQEITEEKSQ